MAGLAIRLASMSKDDFREFVMSGEQKEDYAQERSRNMETRIDEERKIAKEQYAETARGFESGRVRAAFIQDVGTRVGFLVYEYDEKRKLVFLLYIKVLETFRRKGYGKAALELLEKEAIKLGADGIALNVFGDNDSAKHLYEKSGYRFAFHGMYKRLKLG